MKKVFSILCATLLFGVAAFQFASCTKVDDNNPPRITELRFDIKVNNASAPDTKAVKTDWADGDQIYVFFKVGDAYLDAIKYVTLTYVAADDEWTGALSGDLTDATDLGSAGTMYGIHFPFGGVSIASDGADGVTFLSSGNTNPVLNDLPIYTYYMSGSAAYTVETAGEIATLTGTFDLTIPDDFVYFFIGKSGEKYNANEKYRLSVKGLVPTACTGFTAGVFSERALLADQPVWGYQFGTGDDAGIAFSGKLDDTWSSASDHKFILFSDGDPALSKTMNVTLESHNSVKLKNPLGDNGWTQAVATPTTIDLGTSCLWAAYNLGASSEVGIGWKLGWGQIVPPNYYDSQEWYPEAGIKGDLIGNYAIYDVARAYLGDGWRLPTTADASAIISGATIAYDMGLDYVTLERNGNMIYFPITNYGRKSNPNAGDVDTGYFWTSNWYPTDLQQAYYFYVDRCYEETDYYALGRFLGSTVRPVKDL